MWRRLWTATKQRFSYIVRRHGNDWLIQTSIWPSATDHILPGGGVALMRASSRCDVSKLSDDERTGYNIVLRACRAPLSWIAENAAQDGSLVCEKVAAEQGNFGFDAASGKYGDLIEVGVIDPTKVVRTALENAASVSTLLLTSDALIAEKPKDESSKRSPGHGGDYDMD